MHDFYITKFFQRMIFGKSRLGGILLTVLAFLLNLGIVMGVDFCFFHSIPLPEAYFSPDNTHRTYPDFRDSVDGEILDITGEMGDGYHILYRDAAGVSHVVRLDGSDVFRRYWLKVSSRITLPAGQDPFSYEEGNPVSHLRFTVSGDRFEAFSHREFALFSISGISKTLSIHIAYSLLLLFVEYFILKKLKGED